MSEEIIPQLNQYHYDGTVWMNMFLSMANRDMVTGSTHSIADTAAQFADYGLILFNNRFNK